MDFHPSLLIMAALLLVGTRMPGVLLGGTLFTYPLGAVSDQPWLGSAYVGVAMLINVVRYVYAPHKLKMQPADFAAVSIVLLSAMSIYWSVDPDSSVDEAVALFFSVAGMYGVGRLLPQDQGKSVREMVWAIAILSPLISLLLLNQRATLGWAAQHRLLIDGSSASAVGISQPFAGCLLACSMLLLMRVPIWQKIFVLLAFLVVTYTAIASGTRSVFLAYGVGLLIFFALRVGSIKPSRLIQGVLVVVVASSLFLYLAPLDDLSQSAGRLLGLSGSVGEDESSLERFGYYNIAWEQFQAHPLQGYGDGGLLHFAQIAYPHNMGLEILSEFGIIGVIVFGFWFIGLFRSAALVRAQDPETGAILIAFLAVVLMQHQVSYSIAMARTMFLVAAVFAAYGSAYRLVAMKRRPLKTPMQPANQRRRLSRAGI
jgi:O-antigen ligase